MYVRRMRDPLAPRRPWNAYAFFVSYNQELLKSQMPNKAQCERMRVSHLGSGGGDPVLGFQARLIERFAAGCRFPGHGPKLEIATPRSQTGVEGVFGTGAYRL